MLHAPRVGYIECIYVYIYIQGLEDRNETALLTSFGVCVLPFSSEFFKKMYILHIYLFIYYIHIMYVLYIIYMINII